MINCIIILLLFIVGLFNFDLMWFYSYFDNGEFDCVKIYKDNCIDYIVKVYDLNICV